MAHSITTQNSPRKLPDRAMFPDKKDKNSNEVNNRELCLPRTKLPIEYTEHIFLQATFQWKILLIRKLTKLKADIKNC